jgi:hypothetical protein
VVAIAAIALTPLRLRSVMSVMFISALFPRFDLMTLSIGRVVWLLNVESHAMFWMT